MELDFNELRELLTVLNQTDIAEFTLKSGDFELVLRKGQSAPPLPALSPPAAAPVAPPAPAPVAPAPAAPPLANDRLIDVSSPMVGTFYRAPAPDEPPFVDKGDRVQVGQTVCIIEAMKLMNEIEAEVAGEVVEILVANGDPVEFGQILMRVNPA